MRANPLFSTGANWVSRFVSLGTQLIFLPLLFRHVSTDEAGLWMLLFQANAMFALLEFGFGSAYMRALAFELVQAGINEGALRRTARIVSFCIAGFSILVGILLGGTIISQLIGENDPRVLAAWTFLCLGNGVKLLSSYAKATTSAYGYVGMDAVSSLLSQAVLITAQICALLLSGSIVWLAVAYLMSTSTTLIALELIVGKRIPKVHGGRFSFSTVAPHQKLMWSGWLTGVSAFLMLKTDAYIIAALGGVGEVPAYFAANQIVFNVHILAVTLIIVSSPFLSRAYKANNLDQVSHIVRKGTEFAMLTWLFFAIFMIFAGDLFFTAWIGRDYSLPLSILILLMASVLLETTHTILASPVRAAGLEVFFIPTLVAASINISLSFLLGHELGVVGVIAATLFSQLLVNCVFAAIYFKRHIGLPLAPLFLLSVWRPLRTGVIGLLALLGLSIVFGTTKLFLLISLAVSAAIFLLHAIPLLRSLRWEANRC